MSPSFPRDSTIFLSVRLLLLTLAFTGMAWIWTIYPQYMYISTISRTLSIARRVYSVGTNCSVSRILTVEGTSWKIVDLVFLFKSRISASFGGIFGLCLGGSVLSAIELFYFLVREFVIFRKTQRRSRKPLPPAAEVFLSVKSQLQKPQDHRELDDGRVHVTWYHPGPQRRKTINNVHKPVKF